MVGSTAGIGWIGRTEGPHRSDNLSNPVGLLQLRFDQAFQRAISDKRASRQTINSLEARVAEGFKVLDIAAIFRS
jgi:hypothetical protein